MIVKKLLLATLVPALTLSAAEPPAQAEITIDCVRELGPIKPMNGVNNGPTVSHPAGDQVRGNFETYRAARIPFARTHDSIGSVASVHCCDISAIFPDFAADGAMTLKLQPNSFALVELPLAATENEGKENAR